ncbi:MAG: hypothetical protein ACI4OJ_12025 [Lachnospiraceae bacterium]
MFLTAGVGFGKSELTRTCLFGCPAVFLTCRDSSDLSYSEEKYRKDGAPIPVVVDDLQLVDDPIRQERVRRIVADPGLLPVLVSETSVPAWLGDLIEKRDFLFVREEDMLLSPEMIFSFLAENGIFLSESEKAKFIRRCGGRAGYVQRAIPFLKEGVCLEDVLNKQLPDTISEEICRYVIPEWDSDVQNAMMRLSWVDGFDLELASAVLVMDENRTLMILRRAMRMGAFLESNGKIWQIEPMARHALQKKALRELGERTVLQCQYSAGLYYEKKNQMRGALSYYRSCGAVQRTAEVLTQGKNYHMWQGADLLYQDAFSSLPEKMIRKEPRFLAANARLCAEKMKMEESEFWYEALEDFAGEQMGGARREAQTLLTALDLTLPQKSSREVLEKLAKFSEDAEQTGLSLPDVSLTEGFPSFMNGVRDFWNCEELLRRGDVRRSISFLSGGSHDAVLSVIDAEILAERAKDDCRALTLSMSAWMQAQQKDPDISFAAVACAARLNLFSGDPDRALFLLDCMEQSARKREETQILSNLSAIRAGVQLRTGDTVFAGDWAASLQEHPFQLSLTCEKIVRAEYFLAVGETRRAMEEIAPIREAASIFHQPFLLCRCDLLLSVAAHRLEEDWREPLRAALQRIEQYHFLRVAAEGGMSLYPLLLQAFEDPSFEGCISASRFHQVLLTVRSFNQHYPHYLEEVTPREQAVL